MRDAPPDGGAAETPGNDGSVIPDERLPEGFARRVDDPPAEPAEPRPAATVVLMRDAREPREERREGDAARRRAGGEAGSAGERGADGERGGTGEGGRTGIEVLLLRRVRTSGFVPGAWVFPGGRVDRDDAGDDLLERLEGLSAAEAARRMDLPEDADPPAVAYWIAALREAFEETGILVGRDVDGHPAPSAGSRPDVRTLRDALLEDEDAFPSILDAMGCRMDGGAVAYIAHWITPVAEPRRYDTRFFAAAVDRDQRELLAAAEMSEGVWITPAEALRRNARGELPMVFPTIRTLKDLTAFDSPEEVLEHWADREVPTILPRLVRREGGVAIEVPE